MEEIYRLETRDRPRVLVAIMRALAAEDSRISFEGTLSRTELAQMAGVKSHEGGALKRATLQPKLDFLVLPLTQQNLSALEKAVVSKIGFGHRGIIHYRLRRMERWHSLPMTTSTESVSSPIPLFRPHCLMN